MSAQGQRRAPEGRAPKAIDYLSVEEIKELVQASDLRGAWSVLVSWSMIAGSLYLVAIAPHPLTVVLALVVLGGRQLALAVLMHECSHRALFASRRLNTWVGKWLCGAPVWSDLARYRAHHLRHHRWAGFEEDPDISLVEPFPTTPRSMARKLARDLFGLTGLRRLLGLVMMDLGLLRYTASAEVQRTAPENWRWRPMLRRALEHLPPVIVTNLALFVVLSLLGHGWLYALWVGAYLTTFSLFLRLRSIAEHSCMPGGADPFESTRTTRANWLARLTVAPHDVNYHLEHHLLMTVPHYKLARLHALLVERGAYAPCTMADGYGEVLSMASSAQDQ